MLKQLIPVFALGGVEPETTVEEVETCRRDLDVLWHSIDSLLDVPLESIQVLSLERILACKHLE